MIDYTQTDFTQGGATYDIILDTVGNTTFARCDRVLSPAGYYLSTLLVGAGPKGWWYARTTGKHVVGGTAAPRREALECLKQIYAEGRLKPVIDRCYPLAQIPAAHRYVDTGHKQGNVVITVDQGDAGAA